MNKFVTFPQLYDYLGKNTNNPKVVLTTGVFDVPHVGHPRYLAAAKSFGDILIVGVHSDKLVKKRKGDNRPIYPIIERMEFLSYYSSVDYIFEIKDQEEVYNSITLLCPHFLVVSETTEDYDNSPKVMHLLFDDFINVVVLEPQSKRHSSDFIELNSILKK